MKQLVTNVLAATILTVAISAQAAVKSHAGTVIVEGPSDLPEAAQTATSAMYLHETSAGEVILYLEQSNGKRLAALDVTDPLKIRTVSQVALNAAAPFDFAEDLGDSAVLIRYCDNSGVAVLSFRNYKRPVLHATSQLTDTASYELLGQTGLLVQHTGAAGQPAFRAAGYDVVDVSAPARPAVLATIRDVKQRLFRAETGTVFLLNAQGVTVVRQPQVEREHAAELVEMSHN